MRIIALLVLLAAVSANAQIKVCDEKIKPGKVPATSFSRAGSTYSNSYSDLSVSWPRPKDSPSPGGLDSCVTEYDVEVFGRDGKRIQSAVVKVSPAHSSASYTAKGLTPGAPYQFTATARGPAGVGPTDIKSTPFSTAPAPSGCKQPQAVSNIRRESATNQGAKSTMTIAWDGPSDAATCIKEYVVTVYEAGSKTALRTATVPVSSPRYSDSNYVAGKSYEFYIYGRNPGLGAMGNGIGLRSPPIMAPVGATPL